MANNESSENDQKQSKDKYVDLARAARVLQILLAVAIFMRLFDLAVGLTAFAFPLMNDAEYEKLIALTEKGAPIASLLAGLMLLAWMGQAYTNLHSLNVKLLGNKSLRCFWGWIIPFANLVIPYRTMQDIWKASDPSVTDPKTWLLQKSSVLISTWWFTHLLTFVLGVMARAHKDSEPMVQFLIGIAIDIAYTVTGLQLILVVRKIGARQESKRKILEAPDTVSASP